MFHHDVEDVKAAERMLWRFGLPFGIGAILLIAGILGLLNPTDRGLLPVLSAACGGFWIITGVAWGRRELDDHGC